MIQKEIVILANSVKHGKHCVAGKCLSTGNWVRPVSNRDGDEINKEQAKYQNPYGTFVVKTLQKIQMSFSQHVPLLHQPENYLIDDRLWRQKFLIDINELPNYLDEPSDLWGTENRVQYAQINSGVCSVSQSLYLVQVKLLNLYYLAPNKRRASFSFGGVKYDLPATDPCFDVILSNKLSVKSILCISLGEEYNEHCYKIVATIF